jgi:hypothetical protein
MGVRSIDLLPLDLGQRDGAVARICAVDRSKPRLGARPPLIIAAITL